MLYGEIGQDRGASSSNLAIGRLLSHILRVLSEVLATSKKYDLVLSTADKIINDNLHHHNTSLHDATCNVLSSAFSATCKLLRDSLHKSKSSQVNNRTSCVLCLLPFGLHLATGFETIRACINSLANDARHNRSYGIVHGAGSSSDELLAAEKLANELLWIVNKMRLCSMSREVIVTWGYESGLASLVVDAHPRVQGPIVRIFAMLLDDLTSGEWKAQWEVKYRMITTWLPTLCYVGNDVTSHVITRGERQQMERRIEALIYSLPYEDQEVILWGWVEDFARSDSDWPDVDIINRINFKEKNNFYSSSS